MAFVDIVLIIFSGILGALLSGLLCLGRLDSLDALLGLDTTTVGIVGNNPSVSRNGNTVL